jgi:hypothetical protein
MDTPQSWQNKINANALIVARITFPPPEQLDSAFPAKLNDTHRKHDESLIPNQENHTPQPLKKKSY